MAPNCAPLHTCGPRYGCAALQSIALGSFKNKRTIAKAGAEDAARPSLVRAPIKRPGALVVA